MELWTADLSRDQVAADGSALIQALVSDILALLEVQDQCQAEHDAIATAREYLIKRREEILRELSVPTE